MAEQAPKESFEISVASLNIEQVMPGTVIEIKTKFGDTWLLQVTDPLKHKVDLSHDGLKKEYEIDIINHDPNIRVGSPLFYGTEWTREVAEIRIKQ